MAPQDQLKQLQEILGSLSLQEEKTRVSQHRLDQQLNSEAQRSSSLVAQLRAMVAEREAKVRQLELELEIGQLSVQVSRALAQPAGSQVGQVHPLPREASATSSSLHLCSLGLHHLLPCPAWAPCFHLAPRPMLHTPFLTEVQI